MKYWGRMEFVAISIGHTGITLHMILEHLTTAISAIRPQVEQARASKVIIDPAVLDSHDKSQDYPMFKSLLDSITD